MIVRYMDNHINKIQNSIHKNNIINVIKLNNKNTY